MSKILLMRIILATMTFMLGSCASIQRDTGKMTADEILQRSTHVFIGVIEKQETLSRLRLRVSGKDGDRWRVIDIRVRVEMVLRGVESRPTIDIYEAFPTGGLSGDWNLTQDNRRYVFPVRRENGRYRTAQDFWRSIYPLYSGRHSSLPFDASMPLWERIALLQWWVKADRSAAFGDDRYTDPSQVFGRWREAKVLRGLLRHPDIDVRLAACEDLLHMGRAQDECWDTLAPQDRRKLNRFWNVVPPDDAWRQNRDFEDYALRWWDETVGSAPLSFQAINELRLLTTIRNPALRHQFCDKFQRRFPEDTENGCPADRSPPATVVTQDADVPLNGTWPRP